MALAIDTKHLVKRWIPLQEDIQKYRILASSGKNHFQVHRVFAYATVHQMHDKVATSSTISATPSKPDAVPCKVDQAALDWQADQGVDQDPMEVLHHLKQMAATSSFSEDIRQNYSPIATTTLLASAQSPTFTRECSALAQGRPSSSFHRLSIRRSIFHECNKFVAYNFGETRLDNVLHSFTGNTNLWPWSRCPEVVWAATAVKPGVFWHIQLDYVDLLSPITHPSSRRGKRRRTLNPVLQVSPGDDGEVPSRVDHIPEGKGFRGVRYRPGRRTWVAEMKPPKWKNKVSFGDFKSEIQAARAVDAAFYHYRKPVNFPDTPQILSTGPTSAGLDEKDKLNLVKEQAKWLASIASTLPCTPNSATRATLGFFSSPESTPLSFQIGGTVVNEKAQSMFQWSVDDAIVDPCSPAQSSSSSVHSTEPWDGPESSRGAPYGESGVEQPCDQLQRTLWLDFLTMSPPSPMFQMQSPLDFQGEVADGLLEQQSFGGAEDV